MWKKFISLSLSLFFFFKWKESLIFLLFFNNKNSQANFCLAVKNNAWGYREKKKKKLNAKNLPATKWLVRFMAG